MPPLKLSAVVRVLAPPPPPPIEIPEKPAPKPAVASRPTPPAPPFGVPPTPPTIPLALPPIPPEPAPPPPAPEVKAPEFPPDPAPPLKVIPTAPGSYMVTVTQVVETCKVDSDPLEIEVRVNELPAINIGSDSTICELDGDLNIYADGEFNSIEWSDGSTGDKMIINNKGTYSVTVTNDDGCESRDEIVIKNFCCKIFHPNIINLSSTSGNNVFQIKETSCVISSKISIFDRWGNLVYKSNNGLDQWDGTWNGKPVELGVYVFIFTYKALDEDDNVFEDVVKGDVTVIR